MGVFEGVADELHLTPLKLIDHIADLMSRPRTHRHRYFGVLAPILAAQGCCNGAGPGRTDATDYGTGQTSHHGRGCDRACAAQAFTGALPVSDTDRQNLRGVPAAVSEVRWADTADRLGCRGHADQHDPEPHRGQFRDPAHILSAGRRYETTVVMRRWARVSRVSKSNRTGTWQRNRPPIATLTDKSISGWAKQRFWLDAERPYAWHAPRTAHHAHYHQTLVVNEVGEAVNQVFQVDWERFQGAIVGLK